MAPNDPAFAARVKASRDLNKEDHQRLAKVDQQVTSELNNMMLRNFDPWLERHGLSAAGRRRIAEFLRAAWAKELERHVQGRP
jgi:hypothetical protein